MSGSGALPRAALPAARTRLTAVAAPAGGFTPTTEDEDSVAEDNPMVAKTPFLRWRENAAASTWEVSRFQAHGILLAAEHWNLSDQATRVALGQSNLAEHGLRALSASTIVSDLEMHALFDGNPAGTKGDFVRSVVECQEYDRRANIRC